MSKNSDKVKAAKDALDKAQADALKIANAAKGGTTTTGLTGGAVPGQFIGSTYPMWENGKVSYLTRDQLNSWANKNLTPSVIKQYQMVLKSAGLLSKSYIINGKIDLKGQFTGALAKVIGNQVDRGVTGETLADGIKYVKENVTPSTATTGTTGVPAAPRAYKSSLGETTAEIDNEFKTMFGVGVPKDVASAYQKELSSLELSRTTKPTKVKGVDVITQGVSAEERQNILQKYVKQYAGTLTTSALSGDANAITALNKGVFGSTLTTLRGMYSDNGLPINEKTLYGQVVDSALDKGKLESNLNLIRLSAKISFPALAKHIDAGYTVKQLMSPYINSRANILEEDPNNIDLTGFQKVANNPDGNLMSLNDYEISLRQDPKWRFTKNAQDSLSSVAGTLAKTFGMVG